MELDKSKTILALLLGCITLMGTAFSVDARYAKQDQVKKVQESVKKVETRLDNKILKDRANLLQERIWKYEDRYDGRKMPDTIKEVVRDLQKEAKSRPFTRSESTLAEITVVLVQCACCIQKV